MRFPRSGYFLALLIALVVWQRAYEVYGSHFPPARTFAFFDEDARPMAPARCEGAGILDGTSWYRICGTLFRFDLVKAEARRIAWAPTAAHTITAFTHDAGGAPIVAFARTDPELFRVGATLESLGSAKGLLRAIAPVGDGLEVVTTTGIHTRDAKGTWTTRPLPGFPSPQYLLLAADHRTDRWRFWLPVIPDAQGLVPPELHVASRLEGGSELTEQVLALPLADYEYEVSTLLEPSVGNVLPEPIPHPPLPLVIRGDRVEVSAPPDPALRWQRDLVFHGWHRPDGLTALLHDHDRRVARLGERWLEIMGGRTVEIREGARSRPDFARASDFRGAWTLLPMPDGGLFALLHDDTSHYRLDANFERTDAPNVRDRIERMFVRARPEPLMPLRKALLPAAALAPLALLIALVRAPGSGRRGILVALAMLGIAYAVWPLVSAF